MVKILDKTSRTVLVKFTIQEYEKLYKSGVFNDDSIEDYEFIFKKPIKASFLLKNI